MDNSPSLAGLEYIVSHIHRDFMQFLHHTGLSMPQIHALMHIYHAGECQLSDIGGLADSSKPAVSQLVDRLVQQGLVERLEDPDDRRNKKLRLTHKGRSLIQNGFTTSHFLTGLIASLPPKQRETVHAAFSYLAQAGGQIRSSHKQKESKHA